MTTYYSPTPWTYDYNPYTLQRGEAAAEELPAFEVFDAEQNKIFDTNEDMPCEIQEANARLAASAPDLLVELVGISEIWSNAEGGSEVMDYLENRLYAIRAAIAEATADGHLLRSHPVCPPEPCDPAMLEALRLAQSALNTAPRFRVGDTDSYKIAAQVDAAIEAATARREPQ